MESLALEEKINKIRLRNEEIKRRYEEVEADKKNAAKLDALVEPIPADDWPERREPPEFSAPITKQANKSKHSIKRHSDQGNQYYCSNNDGKKTHNFGDGQGPPPDPKYNFLADSERDEHGEQIPKDTERGRGRNKPTRGGFRRRGSGRDWHAKEQWGQHPNPGDMTAPEYEAWRAERNRIDEARISRQRTAEGNWRREWDNDKVHLADDAARRDNRVSLGDIVSRQEHGENEKYYRAPRTAPRNSHYANSRDSYHGSVFDETNRSHGSGLVMDSEKRVVVATDKSIKVMVAHGSTPPKSTSVMSVKVSSTNIAGTGRVGPRQRPRVMYSSQSEAEVAIQDRSSFARQKSVDERTRGRQSDQAHKLTSPKSPHPQRHRDGDAKAFQSQRKDNEKADGSTKPMRKDAQKSPRPQRRGNAAGNYPPKSPRGDRRSTELARETRSSDNSNATFVRDSSEVGEIDSSFAIDDDELLGHVDESTSERNCVSMDETLETSRTPEDKPVFEIMDNDEYNACVEQFFHQASSGPVIELTLESVEGAKNEPPKEFYGEASGTQENVDADTTDSQTIDCSANSGMTSNDSGYIELPSNDSIHDVSENDTTATSGIGDTSSESIYFINHMVEENLVIDHYELAPEVEDQQTVDDAKPSVSIPETLPGSENVLSDITPKNNSKEATNATAILAESETQDKDAATLLYMETGNAETGQVDLQEKNPSNLQTEADNNLQVAVDEPQIINPSEGLTEQQDSSRTIEESLNAESIRVQSEMENSRDSPEAVSRANDADNSELAQTGSHTADAGTIVLIYAETDDNSRVQKSIENNSTVQLDHREEAVAGSNNVGEEISKVAEATSSSIIKED